MSDTKKRNMSPWSDAEIAMLRKPLSSNVLSREMPGRTADSISRQRRKLGISSSRNVQVWDEKDIKKLHGKETSADLSGKLGRPAWQINAMRRKLGIYTSKKMRSAWTDEELVIVKRDAPVSQIANLLPGRSPEAIASQRRKLGFVRRRGRIAILHTDFPDADWGLNVRQLARSLGISHIVARRIKIEKSEEEAGTTGGAPEKA